MSDLLTLAADTAHHVHLAVPNPGSGEAPPGSGKLLRIVRWGFWGLTIACILGIGICGGMMALSHNRGNGGEHAQRIGIVLMGCFLVGSASGLVAAVI